MKYSDEIQKLLPLGYIYLVVLGILKESFFYYQFGINILKYSTIMDILISPIADFMSNPITLVTILLIFIFHIYLPKILQKYNHKKSVQKLFKLKPTDELSEQETINYYNTLTLKLLASVLLYFFVGTGIGNGHFALERVKNNTAQYNSKLNYTTGESEQIFLLGCNSLYYFYIQKGTKIIKITPLASIKNIESNLKTGFVSK